MIAGSLARRYARALFDLGSATNTYDQIGREVEDLAASYEGSRELAEALTNPVFPMTKRRAVLEALLTRAAVSKATRNFALLILDRQRIPYLPAIARELRAMVDEKAGRIRAEVTSTAPLPAEATARIQAILERASGKKVILESRQDAALLGGVVTRLGDLVYDGSIRTQLELMRERFLS